VISEAYPRCLFPPSSIDYGDHAAVVSRNVDGLSTNVQSLFRIFRRHIDQNTSFVYYDNDLGFEQFRLSVFVRTVESLLAGDGGEGTCHDFLLRTLQVAEEKEKYGMLLDHSATPVDTRERCRSES